MPLPGGHDEAYQPQGLGFHHQRGGLRDLPGPVDQFFREIPADGQVEEMKMNEVMEKNGDAILAALRDVFY